MIFHDAQDIYFHTTLSIMDSLGITLERYSKQELLEFMKLAGDHYENIYNEFMLWVGYGDDKKAKTKGLIRVSLRYGKKKFC